MSDGPPPKKADAGTPAWVMTFADLMSLLMCFFVLLFSFSEMDVNKYKQIAGSMKEAFGVQRQIKVKEPPRGLRVITNEFSPGRPEPTPLNVVRQNTSNDLKRFMDMGRQQSRKDRVGATATSNKVNNYRRMFMEGEGRSGAGNEEGRQQAEAALAHLNERQKEQFKMIGKALEKDIEAGKVDVELKDKNVIIRIREKASFPSGDAELRQDFDPVVQRMAQVLSESEGSIVVAGHTDDVPIHNTHFRSNWDLSSARAASTVHALLKASNMDRRRFRVEGLADTRPIAENNSLENRALNRRVEVVLEQGGVLSEESLAVQVPEMGEEEVTDEPESEQRGRFPALPDGSTEE